MPKKKIDPLLQCLHYFRDAQLEAAKTALVVCSDLVQHRMVEAGEVKPKVKKVTRRRALDPALTNDQLG